MKKFILILLVAILSACSNSTDTPEMVTKSFLKNMYKGDSQAVLKIVSDSKNEDNIEIITNASDTAKTFAIENGGVSSIAINNTQYNEDKTEAIVNFIVKFKKGNTDDIGVIPTIKIDSKWKILIPENN